MKFTIPATQAANLDPAALSDELIAAMGSNFGISTAGPEITVGSRNELTAAQAVQFQAVLDAHLLAAPARAFKKQEDALNAIVTAQVEKVARRRGYDSAVSCASYTASTNVTYKADATTFIAWRDAVWSYCSALLASVRAGTAPVPTESSLLSGLATSAPFTAW